MFLEDMPKKEKELNKDLKTKIQGNKQYNIFSSIIKFEKLSLKDKRLKLKKYNEKKHLYTPYKLPKIKS